LCNFSHDLSESEGLLLRLHSFEVFDDRLHEISGF
jgi:hypothetical protein